MTSLKFGYFHKFSDILTKFSPLISVKINKQFPNLREQIDATNVTHTWRHVLCVRSIKMAGPVN